MFPFKAKNLRAYLCAEYNYFRLALGFFSRIPMGRNVSYAPEYMHTCTRYFPAIGYLLAIILCSVYVIASSLFNDVIALVLLMIISIMLTGALHEDGLADTFDGFWGGLTTEQKIDIMKDSRIGTYGTCGLTLVLGLKFTLLLSLSHIDQLVLALLIAYPMSRASALSLVQDLPYVSHLGKVQKNKSDPLAKPVSTAHLLFVLATGSLSSLFLPLSTMSILIIVVILTRYTLKYWMNNHIGGFTGDVLGAAQQIQEVVIYLTLFALLQVHT